MDFSLDVVKQNGNEYRSDLVVYTVPKRNGGVSLRDVTNLPDDQLNYFDAENGETTIFYEGDFQADRCMLVGLGKEDDLDRSDVTALGGDILEEIEDLDVAEAGLVFPLYLDGDRTVLARELCLGMKLAGYEFDEYEHDDDTDEDEDDETVDLESLSLIVEDGRSFSTVEGGLKQARPMSEAVSLGRDLGNKPANDLTPEDLAEKARNIANESDATSVTIWNQERLIEDGMNLLNSVGKGSENPPRLIQLHYEPDKAKSHVGLAGKGVTFDTGGISIKPSKNMDEMKFDMCGAAAVLGILDAVSSLGLPLEVTGFVAAAENMPGHRSVKPGDIVTGYYGKSVEILNTDAEGRLCLADTLGYISENLADDLDVLMDFATLTGACITALGHEAAGLMGNDDHLCEQLTEAGQSVQERVWQLPLWDEHTEQMDSDIADVKNMGGDAGAITAGAFLREFVDEDKIDHWAHLDIAGTGWGMKSLSYRPDGGTGFGVRLVIEFLRERFSINS